MKDRCFLRYNTMKLKERGFDSSVSVQAFYYLIAAEKRRSLADRATAEGEREGWIAQQIAPLPESEIRSATMERTNALAR